MALQALSEYNIRTRKADSDMTVMLLAENWPEKAFKLTTENALVQQSAKDVCI